jgi:acetyl esterase/lipase
MSTHYVIFVPGLGDHTKLLSFVTKRWSRYGLQPVIYSMKWHDGEGIRPKLDGLLDTIDNLSQNGNKVSLVGCSAGGSAILNAFYERKKIIYKAIAICARLKRGNQSGFCSLDRRSTSSMAFAQSVGLVESYAMGFTASDRDSIMTIRAIGDELVPADTAIVHGAHNVTIPVLEHSLAIYSALTMFSGSIVSFLS